MNKKSLVFAAVFNEEDSLIKQLPWIFCCSLVLATGGGAQTASSQDDIREISFTGGIAFPYLPSEFKNYWKEGWSAGLAYGYSLPQGKAGTSSLSASAEFSRFAADRTKLFADFPSIVTSTNPSTVVTVMVNYRGTFSSMSKAIQPFIILGIGFFHSEQGAIAVAVPADEVPGGEVSNGIAWTAGVGLTIPVNEKFECFLQGRSLLAVAKPVRQSFPLTAGIRYRY